LDGAGQINKEDEGWTRKKKKPVNPGKQKNNGKGLRNLGRLPTKKNQAKKNLHQGSLVGRPN